MNMRALPHGTWLLFDPDDVTWKFSVWVRDDVGTRVVVSWAGSPLPGFATSNFFPPRIIWAHVDDADLAALTMAAEHGAFERVARATWERIMA